MSVPPRDFAHRTAVEVYGAFMDDCVVMKVAEDRADPEPKLSPAKIDGRPVRLATISGKGGWSPSPERAARWECNDNVSLLDHSLSVARGALMIYLSESVRPWSGETEHAEVRRIAAVAVCIAFLHDIDKDLGLGRGERIDAAAVDERMNRYGIHDFLKRRGIRVSPSAMRNYIEEVEGTQAAKTAAAADYDRRIASACHYIELADKLEGTFTDNAVGKGVGGVIGLIEKRLGPGSRLSRWKPIEIHDHLHVFLMDRFQRALSAACRSVAGCLPLLELVHDGRLLCVIPRDEAEKVERRALKEFLDELPFGLRFEVNNRLACKFVGGAASWDACRKVMARRGDWPKYAGLLALPREFAREHRQKIDELFEAGGMETSWSALEDTAEGATVKPVLDHPGGDTGELDMDPASALVFLVIALNHEDGKGKAAAPDASVRERELLALTSGQGLEPPPFVRTALERNGRPRRVLLALWTIGEIWRSLDRDPDEARGFHDAVLGREGLAGLWIDGAGGRPGLSENVADVSSDILKALRERFSAYLSGRPSVPFDPGAPAKRCILCNEPVDSSRRVDSGSRAHGVKVSAFSGRDGRNDHLASSQGDTHLCPVCLAELQLRQDAQGTEMRGGHLPPLVSSPVTVGLFGGLAYERENTDRSLGLNDLNRLAIRKDKDNVYRGLDCQTRRIRVARLETLPGRDVELVNFLHKVLTAIRRLGRPIHIFRGAAGRHPAIFHFDAMPPWLEKLLGGNSLRLEQIPVALDKLEFFKEIAQPKTGLGIEWARRLADPDTALGALCIAWAQSIDRGANASADRAWTTIRQRSREWALTSIREREGKAMKLKDHTDPLIRLGWLATRIQKRRGVGASANKQLLCWKIAMNFLPAAWRTISKDRDALVLGLAGALEDELTRKSDAAARKHRDNQELDKACIAFAEHFTDKVWHGVFRSREPASREQRQAAAIYRFALLEAYRERAIPETSEGAPGEDGWR